MQTEEQEQLGIEQKVKNIQTISEEQCYDELEDMFDKEMKRVNTFVDMNTELVKGSKTKVGGSSKREGDELESYMLKKQKIDENVEVEKDDQRAKHENTRLEDDYERVLWVDLKVMFEPDIKSDVWRNIQSDCLEAV
ncbi:hypothetical protein Tco_0257289 [Tanacetum coccineum]